MKKFKAIVIIITLFVIGIFSNVNYAFAEEKKDDTVTVTGATGKGEAFDDNGAGGQNTNRIKGVNGETGYCLDAGYTPISDGAQVGGCTVTDITNEAFGQGLAKIFSDDSLSDSQIANYVRGFGTTDIGKGWTRTDKMGDFTDSYFNLGKSDYISGITSGLKDGSFGNITYNTKQLKDGSMRLLFNNTTGKDGTFSFSDLSGLKLPDGLDPSNINIPSGISSLLLQGLGTKNASGDCNQSFTGGITSPVSTPAGNKCSQVLYYECPGDDTQHFASCGKMDTTPEGGGETPINGGEPVPVECPPEEDCPYDPEDFVDELDGDGQPDRVADGLCDWGGSQKYIKQESTIVSQTLIDNCAPEEENEIKGYSDYCNLYCIEDYEFNVGSGFGTKSPLKIDPDYEPITAGTYFNFDPQTIEIKDKVSASCYTVGHIDAMMADIYGTMEWNNSACEGTPQNGNDYCKKTCTTGTRQDPCGTNPDGSTKYCPVYWKKILIDYWTAQDNQKFEFTWTMHTGQPYFYEERSSGPYTCSGDDNRTYGKNAPNPDFDTIARDSDKFVQQYNDQCTNIQNHVLEQTKDCAKKLTYSYYDGEVLVATDSKTVTPREFESNANGEQVGSGKNCYNPQGGNYNQGAGNKRITYEDCGKDAYNQEIKVGPSKAIQTKLFATTTSGGSAEKGYVYTLEPPTIKNSYGINRRAYDFGDAADKNLQVDTEYKGWPIAFDTPQGRYRYYFWLDEVGSCVNNDQDFLIDGSSAHPDDDYIDCVYDVNGCEMCTWWCNPDSRGGCSGLDKCLECLYSCVGAGCVYDQRGGLAINYIPISLLNIDQTFDAYAFLGNKYNNVLAVTSAKSKLADKVAYLSGEEEESQIAGLPSNLDYSRNWNTEKGKTILNKYDSVGEDIYNESSSAYGLEYRFVLTPKTIKKIQDYNDAHEGYADNLEEGGTHLRCFKVEDDTPNIAEDGKYYVECVSDFLDQVAEWANDPTTKIGRTYQSSKAAGVNSIPKGTNKEVGPAFK